MKLGREAGVEGSVRVSGTEKVNLHQGHGHVMFIGGFMSFHEFSCGFHRFHVMFMEVFMYAGDSSLKATTVMESLQHHHPMRGG